MPQITNSNASKTWPKTKFLNALKNTGTGLRKLSRFSFVDAKFFQTRDFFSSNVDQTPSEAKE